MVNTREAQVSGRSRILASATMNCPRSDFESLDKGALHALCDRLLADDSDAVEECIAFIEAETMGLWHGRARAMMARRLKHCRLSQLQRTRVVHAILDRFVRGRFSEQFKDQLRFVLHLAPESGFAAARSCQAAPKKHVSRYANWILSHEAPSLGSEPGNPGTSASTAITATSGPGR